MKSLSTAFMVLILFAGIAAAQDVPMNVPDNANPNLGNSTVQSETNHGNGTNGIIGAWNDGSQYATLGTMWTDLMSWSNSATGLTFSGGGFFSAPGTFPAGDPAIVFDSAGFGYVASLTSTDRFALDGIAVSRTTGSTFPFTLAAPTMLAPPAGTDLDKEFMAIDNTGGPNNGRIYLAASAFGANVNAVVTHTTSITPLTFDSWQTVTTSGFNHGTMPAVGPSGEVYVVWGLFGASESVQIVKSTDGGGSWINPSGGAIPKTIATFTSSPASLNTVGTVIRIKGFPHIAVDNTPMGSPTRGNVYVVWHADPDAAGTDKGDIFFTRSTNGGSTWSTPRSITSGPAVTLGTDGTTNDSFLPSIAVSPVNGHIYVSFYDRRDDTTAADGDPANIKTRLYRALSTDGGLTWSNASLSTASFVPTSGFFYPGYNTYFADYNWATADANGIHFSWSDARNLCAPPMGAPNPCSPSGAPEVDAYYRTNANLSGADLFIQPWGYVTGIGPTWQTPDIYVVNASDVHINASKGVVNRLRAHVRNLGNAAANNVTVRFKYAPWFSGINDALLKQVGTVSVNFSAVGGGMDDQVVPIDWDLTDLTDTNGGLWPSPISAFTHFCMKVSVEFASDIHMANNNAQNNFVDVGTSSSPSSSAAFMVVGPEKKDSASMHIEIGKLPEGFRASVKVDGVENPTKTFRLKRNEARMAKVTFVKPSEYKSKQDVVANISLLVDGAPSGGVSARLYRGTARQPSLNGLPAAKGEYIKIPEAKPQQDEVRVPRQEMEPPPARTIPKDVKYRQRFNTGYDEAFKAAVAAVKERFGSIVLADEKRGLINAGARKARGAELLKFIDQRDAKWVKDSGTYTASVWIQPAEGEHSVEVGVDALIAVEDDFDAPYGKRLHSNGTIENSVLEMIARMLR